MPVTACTVDAVAVLVALCGYVDEYADGTPGLVLDSKDLGDPLGFGDGQVPHEVYFMVGAYLREYRYIDRRVWDSALLHFINNNLLPTLGNPPVRIKQVSSLRNRLILGGKVPPGFRHGTVCIPWTEVVARTLVYMGAKHPSDPT